MISGLTFGALHTSLQEKHTYTLQIIYPPMLLLNGFGIQLFNTSTKCFAKRQTQHQEFSQKEQYVCKENGLIKPLFCDFGD